MEQASLVDEKEDYHNCTHATYCHRVDNSFESIACQDVVCTSCLVDVVGGARAVDSENDHLRMTMREKD